MLTKSLKNIIHSLGQHKELIAIYCFEEYLCDVFLSAPVVDQYYGGTWGDYWTLVPYCVLLLIGLGISHLSRKKDRKIAPAKTAFQSIIRKLQKLQQRFPIGMALVSILLVLVGEIIEQALLENVQLMLSSTQPALLFFIVFPLASLLTLFIDFFFCLPFLITVLVLVTVLRTMFYAVRISPRCTLEAMLLKRIRFGWNAGSRMEHC